MGRPPSTIGRCDRRRPNTNVMRRGPCANGWLVDVCPREHVTLHGCLSTRRAESNDAVALDANDCSHGSMTWSARPNTDGGIVTPSALAVLRLIISSNLVGCSIGRSPGLAPLRILSTYRPARRYRSGKSVPYDMSPPTSTYSLWLKIAGSRLRAASSASRARYVTNKGLSSCK